MPISASEQDRVIRPPEVETSEIHQAEVDIDPELTAVEQSNQRLNLVREMQQEVLLLKNLPQAGTEVALGEALTVMPEGLDKRIEYLARIKDTTDNTLEILRRLKKQLGSFSERLKSLILDETEKFLDLRQEFLEYKTLVLSYQENLQYFMACRKQYLAAEAKIKQDACQAAGVIDAHDLARKIIDLRVEIDNLKSGPGGGWLGLKSLLNRKAIAEKTTRTETLSELNHKLDFIAPDNLDADLYLVLTYDVPQDLNRVLDKIENYYAASLREARSNFNAAISQEENDLEIPEAQLDVIIEKLARKAIARTREYYPDIPQELEDRVVALALQYKNIEFYSGHINFSHTSVEEETQARLKAFAEIDALPYSITSIARRIILDLKPRVIKRQTTLPRVIAAKAASDAKRREASIIKELLAEAGLRNFESLKYELDKDSYFQLVKEFDLTIWNDLKEIPEFRALLTEAVMDAAEKAIVQEICATFLVTPEHTDNSVKLGHEMLEREGPHFLIYNILNAWREPGFSGERPFLYLGVPARDTEIYKYVAKQSPETIAAAAQLNPAVGRIIDLMLEHPDTFATPFFNDPEAEARGIYVNRPNPIYQELEMLIAEASASMFTGGNEAEYIFSLGLCRSLGNFGNSEVTAARINEIFNTTANKLLKEAIVDTALRSLYQGNSLEGLYFLAEHRTVLQRDYAEELMNRQAEILNLAVQHESLETKVLDAAGKLLGLTAGEVQQITVIYQKLFLPPKGSAEWLIARKIDNAERFIKLVKREINLAELEIQISTVRKINPDFYYSAYDISETGEIVDPYVFFCKKMHENFTWAQWSSLERLQEYQNKHGELPEEFTRGFLIALRETDPVLAESPARLEIAPEIFGHFQKGLHEFIQSLNQRNLSTVEKLFFANPYCFHYLARQPEQVSKVLALSDTCPKLFGLLAEGGPLHSNAGNVIRDIFSNGNVEARVLQIEAIFTRKIPYWEQLCFYTESRLGEQLATSKSSVPVFEVRGRTWQNMPTEDLPKLIADPEILAQLESGAITAVPFYALHGMIKREVFRETIRAAVEGSRDEQAKMEADARNRETIQTALNFTTPHLAHGAPLSSLTAILWSGNLPRESLGADCSTDAFAFHTDFWKVDPSLGEDGISNVKELVAKTKLTHYANSGMGVGLIYARNRSNAYGLGREVAGRVQGTLHTALLGGMPSTEISALINFQPENLPQVIKVIVENGFYVPVYDAEGKLVFQPAEYDAAREEMNYRVPVVTWDFSMQVGERLGSNAGGTYAVPSAEGPVNYYVKFETSGDPARIWNEQLADNIYRYLGLPVPETQVVKVGSTYGHASRWVEQDPNQDMVDFKAGFIADCLLANWPIVYARNRKQIQGQTQRMDNGGALLFRARGDRKASFDGLVSELETMRRSYPDLTSDDIATQLDSLRSRFTDAAIDNLVDGVRLPSTDRQFLRSVLRERRDYILNYFTQAEAEQALPEAGQEIYRLLEEKNIDDERLAEKIPEWAKLNGPEGYQHDGVLLGEHIKETLAALRNSNEFNQLSDREQHLAALAMLFHDFGKPTGARDMVVERDFQHEIPSVAAAVSYMQKWGYGPSEIKLVSQAITYDGIVSDLARGKVREAQNNLTPEQLKGLLDNNLAAIKILRAINRADVIATVGNAQFERIAPAYNSFFEQMLTA